MKNIHRTLIAGAMLLAFSAPLAHAAPVEVHRSGTRTAASAHKRHVKKHTTPIISRVNLNTATQAEIARLPYVDSKTAGRIVAARPISDAKDLVTRGILTQAQYDKIHLRISTADADEATPNKMVSGTRPNADKEKETDHTTPIVDRLNLNTASRAALMELPGIDAATADRIIAARPVGDAKDLVNRGVITQEQYEKIHLRVSTKLEDGADKH